MSISQITLRIRTDNHAFEENLYSETARILREFANQLDNKCIPSILKDINGNIVGNINIEV
jgi:hypothetical protein